MGKRKQIAPQRASEEKRNCMSWNMLDGEPQGSVSVIADNDPSLIEEERKAEQQMEQSNSSSGEKIQINTSNDKSDLTDIFDLYVENSEFNITLYTESDIKSHAWQCVFAEFSIVSCQGPIYHSLPSELPDSVSLTLHVGNEGNKCMLCYEADGNRKTQLRKKFKKGTFVPRELIEKRKNTKFWLVDVSLPFTCLQALRCRSFQAVVYKFDTVSMSMVMKIIGTESVLAKLGCVSEAVRPKGVNQSLLVFMEHFYGVVSPGE